MSDSDENANQVSRKRRRYNKLLLDPSINTPSVSKQTLSRWSKHGQGMYTYIPHSTITRPGDLVSDLGHLEINVYKTSETSAFTGRAVLYIY